MENKFDSNVCKLEQEICDISQNINKFKNKNHKTMKNMMEKIESFSEEFKSKNNLLNRKEKIVNDIKKKTLIKNYQSLSNNDISPTFQNNKMRQIKKLKKPKILKQIDPDDNLADETETIILYSNQKLHDIKNYLSNINNNLIHSNTNINIYDINGNKERHTYKASKSKFFSFNLDDSKKKEKENDNYKRQKTKSLNEIQLNNPFINDLTNDCPNNDLKYDKKNKNEYYKIKNKNKKHIKKVKSYNFNGISKKLIKNIKILTKKKIINSKEIKNVKREHCNINISDYYKNINSKENISNKKKNKIKILNHKRLTNYPSSSDYNSNKIDNKINQSNGIYYPNSSRNSIYYSKISKNSYNNKENNSNYTIAKDYDNYVCNTNLPYYNAINDNESSNGGIYTATRKTLNSLRESIPENNNVFFVNNNQINYLKEYQNCSQLARNSESSYTYYTNRSKNNNSYDINEDIIINKNKIINNSNYNKDFIDIITNKNNDNYKYDFESIYNNNINQKKGNKVNQNQKNYIKYINIDEEKYITLLSLLNSKNLDECLDKIDILLKNEIFINKINILYDKYNRYNSYNSYQEKNLRDIFSWIELNIEQNKKYKDELKKYENFCGKLMEEFNADGFDKFRNDILKTVFKNKNNLTLFNYGLLDYNSNNGNNYIINKNKEKKRTNSPIYNSNVNISFKNKTYSYTNLSTSKKNNGDQLTNSNIKN